jgi:hypothetical protein
VLKHLWEIEIKEYLNKSNFVKTGKGLDLVHRSFSFLKVLKYYLRIIKFGPSGGLKNKN